MIVETAKTGKLESVSDVRWERTYQTDSTQARVRLLDNSEAKKLEIGTDVTIRTPSGKNLYLGNVSQIPRGNEDIYEFKCNGRFKNVSDYSTNNRVFYEKDSGQVMRELVEDQVVENGFETVDKIDDFDDIATTAPESQLFNHPKSDPHDIGDDMAWFGFPRDKVSSGEFYLIRFDNLNYSGDELINLQLRMISNNPDELFDIFVEYADEENNYVWDNDELTRVDGTDVINLNPAEATSRNSQFTDQVKNSLEIRIRIAGELPENRAMAFDFIKMNSVNINRRQTSYNSIDIDDTGREITRQFDVSVDQALFRIAEEEKGELIVTTDNVLKFKEKISEQTSLIIDQDTPTIDVSVDSDKKRVINQVIVDGDGFKIKGKDNASDQFYDSTRKEIIRDNSIKRREEATKKISRILQDNSLNDVQVSVVLPPIPEVLNLEIGDKIRVNRRQIQGTFTLNKIEQREDTTYLLEISAPRNKIEKLN